MIRRNNAEATRRGIDNFQVWPAFFKAPPLRLYSVRPDRCFFGYTVDFAEWVFEESSKEDGHLLSFFDGYRERVPRYSAEIVFHHNETIEIDFDYYNPDYGLLYMMLHGFECLKNRLPWRKRKTDPFKIAAGLKKRGVLPA